MESPMCLWKPSFPKIAPTLRYLPVYYKMGLFFTLWEAEGLLRWKRIHAPAENETRFPTQVDQVPNPMLHASGWPHSDTCHILFLKTGAWGHSHEMLLHSIYMFKWLPFHIISTPWIITRSTPFCHNVLRFLFQQMPCPSCSSRNFRFCTKFHMRNGFK